MWAEFWDWLAKLPAGSASFVGTLTGSSLGLVALLLGALFNAHLNRRRDDALRNADKLAVASALHAELVGIHRSLTENTQWLIDKPPHPEGGFLVPEPTIKVLEMALPRIGLLRSDTIRKVMDAYIVTEQYLERLMLAGGRIQPNVPEARQLLYMPAKQKDFVVDFSRDTANFVKAAIDELAHYLN
jgi:hypothetical protein